MCYLVFSQKTRVVSKSTMTSLFWLLPQANKNDSTEPLIVFRSRGILRQTKLYLQISTSLLGTAFRNILEKYLIDSENTFVVFKVWQERGFVKTLNYRPLRTERYAEFNAPYKISNRWPFSSQWTFRKARNIWHSKTGRLFAKNEDCIFIVKTRMQNNFDWR